MGGVISSIFGGGGSAPEVQPVQVPETEPTVIQEETKDPEAKAVRDEEIKRLKSRRAMAGTLLTSQIQRNNQNLLGQSIQQ